MAVATTLDGARVLIVEDEFFLADDLARSLNGARGVAVGPVNTIDEAEEVIRSEPVDAAIVDLNLRGTMAFEFVKRLAATELPCLIVSGYGEDALPESLAGIPRLEKPIRPSSVIEAIEKELARRH